jgi:hypothetical protein
MTVDHRIVISLDEILSVTLECVNCGARLSSDPDKPQMLYQCPCKQPWHFGENEDAMAFKRLLRALADARALLPQYDKKGTPPPAGFKLLLEIRDPSAVSGVQVSAPARPRTSGR